MTAPTITRTDEQIQRDVVTELNWDARVQPHNIAVSVNDGVVTLTGWVDSYFKRWAAERAARRVRGVRAVANDIEVRLPTSAERTDVDLATAARRALEWDPSVPSGRIDVAVNRGWVTLTGEVEWEYQRRAAERSVRQLSGVRGVTNLIALRPRVTLDPDDLRSGSRGRRRVSCRWRTASWSLLRTNSWPRWHRSSGQILQERSPLVSQIGATHGALTSARRRTCCARTPPGRRHHPPPGTSPTRLPANRR